MKKTPKSLKPVKPKEIRKRMWITFNYFLTKNHKDQKMYGEKRCIIKQKNNTVMNKQK